MSTPRILIAILLLVCGLATQAVPMPSNTVFLPSPGREVPQPALQIHRARMQQRAQALRKLRARLIARHAISPRTALPHYDTFIASPTTTRAAGTTYGNGTLTFAYSGWSAQDEQRLRDFINQAYPVLVNLYGQPAQTATLTIVRAGAQDAVEGGEFNLQNMTLTVAPLPSDFTTYDSDQYGLNLLHLILHAFHAPVLVSYDAWEEGMARAAAIIAMLQLRPNEDQFNIFYTMEYVLPLYDYLNQPALASATFFPAQGIDDMTHWRIGMAVSAWMKVYTEPLSTPQLNVFKAFNTAYYAQLSANTGLPSNLSALKGLMATVVPRVEGLPFLDWYNRQYALQPTNVVGKHLYIYPVPLHDCIAMEIIYFTTTADGSDLPLSGTAQLEYASYDYIPLYPEEGDTVTIPSDPSMPGIGLLLPTYFNIGEPPTQRIRIVVTVGDQRATTYYPYWTRGDDSGDNPDTNEFFGVTLGADSGTLNISVPGIPLPEVAVIQGAFSQQLTTGEINFFAPVKFEYHNPENTQTVTLWRNVGPGYYGALLPVGDETAVTLRHTFAAGLSLVSFPITPNETDAGVLFNYPANSTDFRFTWWDPALTATDKYRRYPAVGAITPGNAYWLNLPAQRTIDITGKVPSQDDPRLTTLLPGWNLIGNTYNASIDPWVTTVISGSTSFSLAEAVKRGIVGPVWTYNATSKSYDIRNRLQAWEGAWLANLTGGELILKQQGTNRSATRNTSDELTRALTEHGWGVRLQARTTTSTDTLAILGVAGAARRGVDALDWQKPPTIGDGVRIAFINPDRRTAGAQYATDIRPALGLRSETWEFEVTSPQTDQISLSWPDLREVPPQYQVILVDEVTNTRQYLRTVPSYTYTAQGTAAQPDTRRFRLVIEPKNGVPLAITQLKTLAGRDGTASIHVTTSAAADLQVEVRTATGKLIRALRVPSSRANEDVEVTWDGQDAAGIRVPAGTYLLCLTARTTEGYSIRRNQPVIIRR